MLSASRDFTALSAFAFIALAASPAAAGPTQTVPFVGCAGDGMTGPVAAPTGGPKAVAVDAATASRLAYYQSPDNLAALAPRGWRCFYFYGSSGAVLVIAASEDPSTLVGKPLTGNGVVLRNDDGGTSGRFAVAEYAARLFPQLEKKFIADVIAEGIEPKSSFPSGPYPADKLTYKTPRLVEFVTPANKDGLGDAGAPRGDSGALQKNASPISGMAKLVDSEQGLQFYLLTVRLPPEQANLAPAIVSQAE